MKKIELIMKVTSILDTYCNGCLLYKCNSLESNKRGAHKFCLKQCTIGKKLQQYGKQLT